MQMVDLNALGTLMPWATHEPIADWDRRGLEGMSIRK
jgi:hypothetical protein